MHANAGTSEEKGGKGDLFIFYFINIERTGGRGGKKAWSKVYQFLGIRGGKRGRISLARDTQRKKRGGWTSANIHEKEKKKKERKKTTISVTHAPLAVSCCFRPVRREKKRKGGENAVVAHFDQLCKRGKTEPERSEREEPFNALLLNHAGERGRGKKRKKHLSQKKERKGGPLRFTLSYLNKRREKKGGGGDAITSASVQEEERKGGGRPCLFQFYYFALYQGEGGGDHLHKL